MIYIYIYIYTETNEQENCLHKQLSTAYKKMADSEFDFDAPNVCENLLSKQDENRENTPDYFLTHHDHEAKTTDEGANVIRCIHPRTCCYKAHCSGTRNSEEVKDSFTSTYK